MNLLLLCDIFVPSPSKKIFLVLSLLLPCRWQFAEMMLSLMFNPPSILQSDIIMEFSITTSDDIIVLSPILALGPIRADSLILQFLPIIDGVIQLELDKVILDSSTIHV